MERWWCGRVVVWRGGGVEGWWCGEVVVWGVVVWAGGGVGEYRCLIDFSPVIDSSAKMMYHL